MQSLPPEERFKRNLLDFAELVKCMISDACDCGYKDTTPELVDVGKEFINEDDPVNLIETFISRSWKYWEKVKAREVDFFLDNTEKLFADVPLDNVLSLKGLIEFKDSDGERVIQADDIDSIFDFFERFIRISINYIHQKRGPKVHNGKPAYSKSFMNEISLQKYAIMFSLDLKF